MGGGHKCQNMRVCIKEEGVAALWVLECSLGFGVLSGFWSCSQVFVVAPRVLELLPGFWSKMWKSIRPIRKSPLKRVLKNRKLKKRALLPLFYCLCLDIWRKKIANLSPSIACGDNIVFISQTNNIYFSLYIKHYW